MWTQLPGSSALWQKVSTSVAQSESPWTKMVSLSLATRTLSIWKVQTCSTAESSALTRLLTSKSWSRAEKAPSSTREVWRSFQTSIIKAEDHAGDRITE